MLLMLPLPAPWSRSHPVQGVGGQPLFVQVMLRSEPLKMLFLHLWLLSMPGFVCPFTCIFSSKGLGWGASEGLYWGGAHPLLLQNPEANLLHFRVLACISNGRRSLTQIPALFPSPLFKISQRTASQPTYGACSRELHGKWKRVEGGCLHLCAAR